MKKGCKGLRMEREMYPISSVASGLVSSLHNPWNKHFHNSVCSVGCPPCHPLLRFMLPPPCWLSAFSSLYSCPLLRPLIHFLPCLLSPIFSLLSLVLSFVPHCASLSLSGLLSHSLFSHYLLRFMLSPLLRAILRSSLFFS